MNQADSQINKLLSSLRKITKRRHLKALEKQRFASDLETLTKRLVTREYLQTSFKPRNMLTIPNRTEEIFSDLSFFESIGQIWETIFRTIKISDKSSILDLGCGYFPKVELGLYYNNFKGTVSLLDPDRRALKKASTFLRFFKTPFTHKVINGSIWSRTTKKYDLIVANHVLDDIVLDSFCKDHGVSLHDLYDDESLYLQAWLELVKSPAQAHQTVTALADHISKQIKRGGYFIFVDYPSFSHRSLKLRKTINLIQQLQKTLRARLAVHGFRSTAPFSASHIRRGRLLIKSHYCVCMRKP